MPDPIITLTSDFGTEPPYVAAMKGVLLGVNPRARLVDLSHEVPPQDILHGAFFLAEAVPTFPTEVIHVAVVDPGVGTERALLYMEIDGHRLLLPDNGLATLLARGRRVERVIQLKQDRYWRKPVSPTFHGRDILAPVAGHLSLGLEPKKLGPAVRQWQRLPLPEPKDEGERISGEVIFVDGFGNLITNIPAERWAKNNARPARRRASALLRDSLGPARIKIGGTVVSRWATTYDADAAGESTVPDDLIGLVSSSGFLEVAAVRGNAARRLRLGVGAPVRVWLKEWLAAHERDA